MFCMCNFCIAASKKMFYLHLNIDRAGIGPIYRLDFFFEKHTFISEVFLKLGSVRLSETDSLFFNLGRLELTYRAQTFRNYSL